MGLEIEGIRPLFFKERRSEKLFAGGERRLLHMIFLVHECRAAGGDVKLNEEFDSFAWAPGGGLRGYDLNVETRDTFERLGL